MILAVDNASGNKVDENGDPVTFAITKRPWYVGAKEKGELFFSDVMIDVYSNEASFTCSLPVYHGGRLAAVIAADVYLDNMEEAVQSSEKNGGFVCVINEMGHVVFSPRKEGSFQVRAEEEASDLRVSDNAELAAFVKKAMQGATDVELVNVDGVDCYLCGYPVEKAGWAIVSVVSKEETDKPTQMLETQYDRISEEAAAAFNADWDKIKKRIFIMLIVILLLGLNGAMIVSTKIVRPLERITKKIGALDENNLQFFMEKEYKTGDEIEVLAESFADLSAKTVQYVEQVKRITAEKERIGVELDMAEKIQASQLPRLFPAFPNRTEFDIYASMTPAKEVGGDFYDYFLKDEDHLCMVMADVAGKGVPAALFMMISRVLLKTRLQAGETPGEALSHLNDQLMEGNETGLFVTIWLAVLEISTGKGIAANAGHEHPTIRRAGGQYELVTYRHSPAVAVVDGILFKEHAFEMYPGDSLFVYTDGVPEATNDEDELFGTDRMLAALNKDPGADPLQLLSNVKKEIDVFMEDEGGFEMSKKTVYMDAGVAAVERRKSKTRIVSGTVLTAFFAFGVVGGILDAGEGLREGLSVYVIFLIPSVILLWRGIAAGRLADAAQTFETVFATDTDGFVTMDELVKSTGQPPQKILKNLKAAFKKGYFTDCTLQAGTDPKVILDNAKVQDHSKRGFVTITCENCGGKTRLRAGSTGVCDYCGGPIRAE